jgi:hypothetical protein
MRHLLQIQSDRLRQNDLSGRTARLHGHIDIIVNGLGLVNRNSNGVCHGHAVIFLTFHTSIRKRQRSEDRGQGKTAVSGQPSEIRKSQRPEARGQRPEVGGQRPEERLKAQG